MPLPVTLCVVGSQYWRFLQILLGFAVCRLTIPIVPRTGTRLRVAMALRRSAKFQCRQPATDLTQQTPPPKSFVTLVATTRPQQRLRLAVPLPPDPEAPTGATVDIYA